MPNLQEYCQSISNNHRKKFGQFFTQPEIAQFMTNWVLESGQKTIYDPAFGLGAFYFAIRDRQDISFYGSEIDPIICKFTLDFILDSSISKAKEISTDPSDYTNYINIEDYLLAWGKQHQNIVCNPPYIRFQNFVNRDYINQIFQEKLKIKLSGYTNIASSFLLKSIAEMDGTGRLAYIMPLEFLNTGYGTLIKQNLIINHHLVGIIKLECEKEIFPDVTTSVGIILYDSSQKYDTVSFYSFDSLHLLKDFAQILPIKVISTNDLKPNTKWLPYFQKKELVVTSNQLVSLSKYGRFSRGIATGANEFFVLKPSDIRRNFLIETEYLPCIARSSQIKKLIFSPEDYQQLVINDSSVCLFAAGEQHSEAADRYIQYGIRRQFHQRYLTRNRHPWYKTEQRESSRLLLGVFSRGGYKVVLNHSNALHLTCFHGFYPNLLGTDQIEKLFLYLASDAGRQIISLSMRKYGDNLDKFEPNDLNTALVPSPSYFCQMPKHFQKDALFNIAQTGCIPQFVHDYFAPLVTFV
jgi:adenine-specific DNA-methyltransferase